MIAPEWLAKIELGVDPLEERRAHTEALSANLAIGIRDLKPFISVTS